MMQTSGTWSPMSSPAIRADVQAGMRREIGEASTNACSHAPEHLVRRSAPSAEGANLPAMTCTVCDERLPAWGYYTG